jgi:tetrathionate reductase subunit A
MGLGSDAYSAAPLHANAVMRVDSVLKNVTLTDTVGGNVLFYDTQVKVVKA